MELRAHSQHVVSTGFRISLEGPSYLLTTGRTISLVLALVVPYYWPWYFPTSGLSICLALASVFAQ